MKAKFFPSRPNAEPKIYAYADTNPQYKGLLKIGFTTVDVQARVAQQYPTRRPGRPPYIIHFEGSAMRNDGSSFTDRDIHRYLKGSKVKNAAGEWFQCTVAEVEAAVNAVRDGKSYELSRNLDFKMRPEQREAVDMAADYFESSKQEKGRTPHFLWNAKMRFGKTFAAYQLALKMDWKKVLVLTFKPAVQSAWEEDIKSHVDFEGWQFISRGGLTYDEADKSKPFVCFGSFQNYLGKNSAGGIKALNAWVHEINWDCVIFDEYHFGAWRDDAKGLFASDEKEEGEVESEYKGDGLDYFKEEAHADHYRPLSLPFGNAVSCYWHRRIY